MLRRPRAQLGVPQPPGRAGEDPETRGAEVGLAGGALFARDIRRAGDSEGDHRLSAQVVGTGQACPRLWRQEGLGMGGSDGRHAGQVAQSRVPLGG